MGKEDSFMNKRKIFFQIGLSLMSIIYIYCVFKIFSSEIKYFNLRNFFSSWQITVDYFLPRLFLYIVDYFTGILLFIGCLMYAKKKKKIFCLCAIISILCLLISLKYNLPLFGRETFTYDDIWKTDIIEYLYPVTYFIILLCILFFPLTFDSLKKYKIGKCIVLGTEGLAVISTNVIAVIDNFVSLPLLLVKGILLYFIYKVIICREDMEKDTEKQSYFIIKLCMPIFFVLCLIVMTVTIKRNCIIILQNEEIDGYWFIGGVDAFIENYENLYQDKRHYLDIDFVKKENDQEKWEEYYTWTWYYDAQEQKRFLVSYEREVEALYYLDLFKKEEYENSLHRIDLSQLSDIGQGSISNLGGYRTYRVVLSSEKSENTVYYYEIKSEIPYSPDTRIFNFLGDTKPRAIEEYDIAIGNKEIPAYFLGMVDCFGVVKVEPYTHYRSENYFTSRKNSSRLHLSTQRQY